MPSQKPPILFHSEFIKLGQVTVTIHDDSRLLRKSGKIMVDMLVDAGRDRREVSYQCENRQCETFFQGTKGKTITVKAIGSRDDARFEFVGEQRTERPAQRSEPAAQSAPVGLRCTEVRYEQTVGLPNYCSEKIGLTVAVEPGTKAADALAYAKHFVEARLAKVGR